MRVLGLDPGGEHTGWALFNGADYIASGVVEDGLHGFLSWWHIACPSHAKIIIEDFVVEPSYVGRATPSEIIGAVIALSPAPVIRQLRSMKATLVRGTESERVKWLNAHGINGQIHALDAATHVLCFLKRSGDKGTVQKYWG